MRPGYRNENILGQKNGVAPGMLASSDSLKLYVSCSDSGVVWPTWFLRGFTDTGRLARTAASTRISNPVSFCKNVLSQR
jgi:hypothetical protein